MRGRSLGPKKPYVRKKEEPRTISKLKDAHVYKTQVYKAERRIKMTAAMLNIEENPIRMRRLTLNLTQNDLAYRSGVGRGVVTDSEAGLYKQPPGRLIECLTSDSDDRASLVQDYHDWVVQSRRKNAHYFDKISQFDSFKNLIISVGGSVRGFARITVLQRTMITAYIQNGQYWDSISEALQDCGLSTDIIDLIGMLPRT